MKFTPELEFEGGKVRPLTLDDLDHLWNIYQQPELPGQSKPKEKEQLARLVDYSIKMAATQRGMMWLLEVDGQVLGMVNVYDWQASLLRDRKSTRLNSSHVRISYAVFCLKK